MHSRICHGLTLHGHLHVNAVVRGEQVQARLSEVRLVRGVKVTCGVAEEMGPFAIPQQPRALCLHTSLQTLTQYVNARMLH